MHNYTLVRARKRTLSLQVTGRGEVIARAPHLMPKFLIDRFVQAKTAWITKRLAEVRLPPTSRLEYFTEVELKSHILKQLKKYGELMGVKPHGVRIRVARSYWGTCAPSGILSFNQALRFTPPLAVTYVCVHELAHLRYRGHGQRFWNMVTKYYPATQEARAILRKIPRNTI